ncbi:unnamed protein product, partial [Haemonchus placei]|uniref:Secreted protein n=1 Tax=Haemonchus placei TaxID=6290 RepID=A0A158QLD9_HAEPC
FVVPTQAVVFQIRLQLLFGYALVFPEYSGKFQTPAFGHLLVYALTLAREELSSLHLCYFSKEIRRPCRNRRRWPSEFSFLRLRGSKA